LQMFLTVFRSNSDQNLTEVPITPETLCRDVVEFCKQPGEGGCYLAEAWRSSGEARPAQNLAGGGEQPTSRHLSVLLLPNRTDGRREGANDGGAAAVGAAQGGGALPSTPASCSGRVQSCRSGGEQDPGGEHGAGGPTPGLPERPAGPGSLATAAHQQPAAAPGLQGAAAPVPGGAGAAGAVGAGAPAAAAGERPQPGGQAAAGASAAGSGGAQTAQQRQTGSVCQETAPERWRRAPAPTQMSPSVPRGGGPADEPAPPAEAAGAPAGRLPGGAAQPAAGGSEEQQAGSSAPALPPRAGASPPGAAGQPSPAPAAGSMLAARLSSWTSDPQLQSGGNQDQSDPEAAAMERRLAQLRQRLRRKKAALLQKDRRPVSVRLLRRQPPVHANPHPPQVGSGGGAPQHGAPARVAAVGPYIQSSSQGRPGAAEPPEDSSEDGPPKPPPRPLKAASGESRPGDSGEGRHASVCLRPWLSAGFLASKTSGWCSGHASTLPRTSGLSRHASGLPACPGSGDPAGGPLPAEPSGPDRPPPVPGRTRNLENLQKDPQATAQPLSSSGTAPLSPFSTGTFPGKTRGSGAQRRAPGLAAGYSSTLPLPGKQDKPPAAAVRPYTPEPEPPPTLQRPPTVAASSIYSMYTQQGAPGRSLAPSGQGTLPRRPRGAAIYGKPVLPASGGQPPSHGSSGNAAWWDPDGMEADASKTGEEPGAEHASPRPLSPTKLLPFLSNPHRNTSDVDLEALRRRLHHAPRPLKKRSSITEPEGPAGPNIQKLLYQKTTLAAMETVPMEAVPTHTAGSPAQAGEDGSFRDGQSAAGHEDESLAPPPLPPRSPVPDPAPCRSLLPPLEDGEEEVEEEEAQPPPPDEFPPYPPPPYPSCGRSEQGGDVVDPPPPEVRGQVPPERKSILRRCGSEPPDRGARVRFNPLALLLDASLEGEYDLVQRVIYDVSGRSQTPGPPQAILFLFDHVTRVDDPSAPNDEGITALHNAVCAGHAEIVKFLVQFGVNANAADSDGWTPLHCAASCNNVQLCKFLVESGAAVFAATHSDTQTAADKCEEMEDGYAQCSQFLYGRNAPSAWELRGVGLLAGAPAAGVQEKMGVMNRGVVYALWDYEPQQDDELRFSEGDCLTVLRREDQVEEEWWWARCGDHEGYIPRNLLGLYLRVKPRQRSLA
ncbi:unnamed protein product, partial [Tetraodon nigroviridis]